MEALGEFLNVKCWIMFTSRWNPNFGSCLWGLNDFGIVLVGTVMASRLNWREGREECGSSCKVCIHSEERHPNVGEVGLQECVWPILSNHKTSCNTIRCQTNFARSQLFAIYTLLRQQACRYSMLRCIKHWQDVRNHGCGALGVDHSLSNKLSRLV